MQPGTPRYQPLEYKCSHNTVKCNINGLPSVTMKEIFPNYLPGWHLWASKILKLQSFFFFFSRNEIYILNDLFQSTSVLKPFI